MPALRKVRIIPLVTAAVRRPRPDAQCYRQIMPGRPLSRRELQVLACLAAYRSRAETAAELFVSVNTVKTHLRNAYAKLGVTTSRDAIRIAAARGLIKLPDRDDMKPRGLHWP